ncbi:GntR family transcriptional regulator [Enterococcus sp. 8G7_MSG3316]|uniref:GntR family transcriptional regulator n=1 Tax=Candidatus Enterococcus testudinis TaxID=1834191 RepID=A0A242A914_9ENTE|nr:GntR family transcriptional regulator [Enterococcus sp. 8G7_MSG3316]OTN77525.1 GntR family transcriptional regulator [Enterococcus sp. 8G7_MSG3316]
MSSIITAVTKNLDLTENKPLKSLIYEAFKKTIILGDITAGSRINEKEFSDTLNISRTPIRYAMQQLTAEKLVEHVPKIGIVVKGISIKDAYEIYDIRKSLDTLATIKAMDLMTESDFEALHALLERGEQFNREDKVDELLENFSDFNAFIYEKSQMLRLKNIVLDLQAYLVYFRDIAIRSSKRRETALNEHWLIYRGMQTKDIQQITMITHEHLDHSLKFILNEMERRKID